jgi:hypothetical protein
MVEPHRLQIIMWCMRFARCVPKATNTHSVYVILIVFQQQQWYVNAPHCYVYTGIACLET